jgi:hypothetical protein
MRPSVSRALLCALLFVSFLPVRSFAGCHVQVVANISPTDPNGTSTNGQITVTPAAAPAILQRESTMERASDVLIYDDTAVAGGNCFVAGNKILLGYSGMMTNPPTFPAVTNLDVYDSNGGAGLNITGQSTNPIGTGGTPTTSLEIDVIAPGTAAVAAGGLTTTATGSAVRIKNLRFDATQLASGAFLTVTVSASNGMPANVTANVGVAQDTIAPGAGVVQEGIGFEGSNSTLTTPAIFDYAENYAGAFRVASANASGVWRDSATTATQVIYDLGTSLPVDVSVNFPLRIQVGAAGNPLILVLVSGGSCKGPVQCTAVYNTVFNGTGVYDLKTTTAATPNTGEDGNLPALGVFIGSNSQPGVATLTVSLVPSHLTSQAGNQV